MSYRKTFNRSGCKSKIAKFIVPWFPKHKIYIEPFFGVGGMFFNKPVVRFNFLNDIDLDIYNLFVLLFEGRVQEIYDSFQLLPLHQMFFKDYFNKNLFENDPIKKAVRYLYLQNYSMHGQCYSLNILRSDAKNCSLKKIIETSDFLQELIKTNEIKFMNVDFRKMLDKICFSKGLLDKENSFIYCDPPYLGTGNNYKNAPKWTKNDFIDLLDALKNSKIRFAISEYANEEIRDLCKDYEIVKVCSKPVMMQNRKVDEFLIVNYELPRARELETNALNESYKII